MPYFELSTNVKQVPAEFHKETTNLIAELLAKPSSVVVVHVIADARLTLGGTDDAAGVVHLYSVGRLEPEQNNSYTKAIAEHLQKHLNIPVSRFMIYFHDFARTHCGFNGKTLAS